MRLIESHNSRDFNFGLNGGQLTWRGMAWGSDDAATVYEYVFLNTDLYLDGFTRREIICKPIGGGVWEVEVPYGTGEFPNGTGGGASGGGGGGPGAAPGREVPPPAGGDAPLEGSFQFSIQAPRLRITQSLQTISSTPLAPFAAKDYKGAIAPDKDGRVQGAEVPPQARSSFTRTVPGLVVTMNFYRTLVSLAGRTNAAKWYEFEARELLYQGCDGSYKQGEGWTLTHKFDVEPNAVNITITAGLVVPAKKGFEYLWVDYHETTSGGLVVTTPRAAYVEKVFEDADFTLLGIG